jgi:hypothetical protein
MSTYSGPEVPNNGLVCMLDASNYKSYNPAENLSRHSEDFTNGFWSPQSGITITANSVNSPVNTLTADTLTGNDVNIGYLSPNSITITNGVTYTFSCYFKAGTQTSVLILLYGAYFNSGGSNLAKSFNLSTGVISQPGGSVTPSGFGITDVGNGWYRCWVTQTATANTTNPGQLIRLGAVTGNLYAWGYQVNIGPYVRPYTVTTTSVVTASSTWTDISGNGNSATLVASPAYNDGVMNFNGTTQYAYNNMNLSTGTSTIIAGARYSGATRNRVIGSITGNYLLGYYSNGSNYYYANGWVLLNAPVASDLLWRIYAGTADVTADVYSLYNGTTLLASNNGGTGGVNGLQIGGGYNTTTELSTCEVSFVLAYNRVLTAGEVSQVFNAYRGRFGI